ncbi:hypothetical protein PAXINDRAFT_22003, partial [Paxillus involutus ATCC 200175]
SSQQLLSWITWHKAQVPSFEPLPGTIQVLQEVLGPGRLSGGPSLPPAAGNPQPTGPSSPLATDDSQHTGPSLLPPARSLFATPQPNNRNTVLQSTPFILNQAAGALGTGNAQSLPAGMSQGLLTGGVSHIPTQNNNKTPVGLGTQPEAQPSASSTYQLETNAPNASGSNASAVMMSPVNSGDVLGSLAPLLSQLSLNILVLQKDIVKEFTALRDSMGSTSHISNRSPHSRAVDSKGQSTKRTNIMVIDTCEEDAGEGVEGENNEDDKDNADNEDNEGPKTDIYMHWSPKSITFDTEFITEAPPPTKDELGAFNRHSPGCIQITTSNLRLDLSGKCTSPFNREAKGVFVDDFRKRVLQEGWYHFPPIPEKYMERDTSFSTWISI